GSQIAEVQQIYVKPVLASSTSKVEQRIVTGRTYDKFANFRVVDIAIGDCAPILTGPNVVHLDEVRRFSLEGGPQQVGHRGLEGQAEARACGYLVGRSDAGIDQRISDVELEISAGGELVVIQLQAVAVECDLAPGAAGSVLECPGAASQ